MATVFMGIIHKIWYQVLNFSRIVARALLMRHIGGLIHASGQCRALRQHTKDTYVSILEPRIHKINGQKSYVIHPYQPRTAWIGLKNVKYNTYTLSKYFHYKETKGKISIKYLHKSINKSNIQLVFRYRCEDVVHIGHGCRWELARSHSLHHCI